jgi:prepilin-type N-terminal cleavage/methylation domain-containing protein
MAFLAISAALKLADLAAFRAALASWAVIPPWLQPILTVAVPSLELLIAGSWFIGRRRSHALAGLVLVGVFTLAFAIELIINPRVKSCGCMGSLTKDTWLESPPGVFIRNGALIGVFAFAAVRVATRTQHHPGSPSDQSRAAAPRPAFTLIETLCVLVLIGLLAVLIMPTLRIIRDMGRQAVSLSNLRSNAAVLISYTTDYKETWPYYTDPDSTLSVIRSQRNNIARSVVYFGLYNRWHLALLDAYYDGQARSAVFNQPYSPGHVQAGAHGKSSYLYPCVFIASAEFWNRSTREIPFRNQYRATRIGEVLWPQSKSLLVGLFDLEMTGKGRREIAMADASARTFPRRRVLWGYLLAEGRGNPQTRHDIDGVVPGLHTIDGVRGRDVIGE